MVAAEPWIRAGRRDTAVTRLPALLNARLPFYYGWVVLGCVCCAGFARQGPAVATLSIFVEPMTADFGWSRTAISGAVSLGGLLAAVTSPYLGVLLDRHGARTMLCLAIVATGFATMGLSLIGSLLFFYLLYCIGRMNFAGPFDLGIYGAINSWFVERRPLATSIATLAQMFGLMSMPLIAHFAIQAGDWRSGWVAVGITVLTIGLLPTWLLMARRPEDLGLLPDRSRAATAAAHARAGAGASSDPIAEPVFTRAQAMRTPAFWMLALYTLLIYPVQAGISLHQAPHLIESGLAPTVAATVISTFSFASAIAGFGLGIVTRRIGVSAALMVVGVCLSASAVALAAVTGALHAYLAAMVFGIGIGGLTTVLPIAWADYFGRRSFGAIRGVALTIQVTAQASGPLLSGALRDWTGDYTLSLEVFAALSLAGTLAILFARPPRAPR
ncbi:OFA family oxalate/formate antiporter-like MFS transporter [Constrictibacter sp. MBR-5]|jgi:sugar phosphate permease